MSFFNFTMTDRENAITFFHYGLELFYANAKKFVDESLDDNAFLVIIHKEKDIYVSSCESCDINISSADLLEIASKYVDPTITLWDKEDCFRVQVFRHLFHKVSAQRGTKKTVQYVDTSGIKNPMSVKMHLRRVCVEGAWVYYCDWNWYQLLKVDFKQKPGDEEPINALIEKMPLRSSIKYLAVSLRYNNNFALSPYFTLAIWILVSWLLLKINF